jgi:hypothetical protein
MMPERWYVMSNDRNQDAQEPIPEDQDQVPEDAEERILRLKPEDVDVEDELAREQEFDTQHGEGHTYNPREATRQGLTYTPPTDPPFVSSRDRPEGIEMGAGFAPSMEDTSPESRRLPEEVAGSDLEIQDQVYKALRYNSETANLTNIAVQVDGGVVHLLGMVADDDDVARVYSVVSDLPSVTRVENHLRVES